jgi:CRP-like cAMP-binding protein
MMADPYGQLDAFLRRSRDFPDGELARARQVFRPVRLERGALFSRAGDWPDRVAFLVQGLVRLVYATDGGADRTHGFRAENQLFCAYSAVLRGERSQMSIEALEPCLLLTTSRRAFDELTSGHPCWRELIAGLTEELYLEQETRQRELLLEDAVTRYLSFVGRNPSLTSRLTQAQIASYIGVTPVALSRIRTRLIAVNDKTAARS